MQGELPKDMQENTESTNDGNAEEEDDDEVSTST